MKEREGEREREKKESERSKQRGREDHSLTHSLSFSLSLSLPLSLSLSLSLSFTSPQLVYTSMVIVIKESLRRRTSVVIAISMFVWVLWCLFSTRPHRQQKAHYQDNENKTHHCCVTQPTARSIARLHAKGRVRVTVSLTCYYFVAGYL